LTRARQHGDGLASGRSLGWHSCRGIPIWAVPVPVPVPSVTSIAVVRNCYKIRITELISSSSMKNQHDILPIVFVLFRIGNVPSGLVETALSARLFHTESKVCSLRINIHVLKFQADCHFVRLLH